MIDVVFEGLTASAVPAIRDPRTNLPFVALAGARPSLSLILFWKIIGTDGGAKLDIKTTLIRNMTEHGNMFFRWSAFCLRCCHRCLPEDMFPNPSEAKLFTERYLLQARLLLKLLDVDAGLSQFILCCDDFLELFLQLWSKEKSIDGPLVSRIVDPTGDYACPIVRLAQRIMANESSKETFFRRCGTKKHCVDFTDAIVDRVNWGNDVPNYNMAGWIETLMGILEVTEVLWSSSERYSRRLREIAFLMQFSCAWDAVTTAIVKEAGCRSEFLFLLKPAFSLMAMAFNAPSHSAIRQNWKWLDTGDFWKSFFPAIACVCKNGTTWRAISPAIFSTQGPLLAHPKLIPYRGWADSSIVKPVERVELQRWNGYVDALQMAQKAGAFCYPCDNPLCSRPVASRDKESTKRCQGCSSVAYCSVECQAENWKAMHKRECKPAREYYDVRKADGTLYGLNTRASQTGLVATAYAQKSDPTFDCRSIIPIFDFTKMHRGSVARGSYRHCLTGADAYWDRKSTLPLAFGQTFLRPRLESLIHAYKEGAYPHDWRIAEGIFPSITGPKSVHLTVLLRPAEDGFQSVYCIARDRQVQSNIACLCVADVPVKLPYLV
ncbi:hypothetical protein NMY22_g4445 [Coprinellus aureogranulatus]|nr:hypothetical protein NMY22_g4445 [Coprinellus aureogranulatus]